MNNTVTISMEETENPPWLRDTESFTLGILDKLGKHHWDLSLFFCSDSAIKKLNKQYRNLDESTDVLSFVMGETAGERYIPGDIVISPEKAKENADIFGVTPMEELHRLIIHGILHLTGMDHATNDPDEPMLRLQEKLLREVPGGEQ